MEGQSQSFRVEGVYYPINVDQVSGIVVLENRILIWRYNLKLFGLGKQFQTEPVEIVRKLPRAYAQFNNVSSDWTLINSRYDVNFSAHTFESKHSGERFIIKLPQGNADIFFNVYELDDKRQLFIITAGEWKVGLPSYFSYFIVQSIT